MKKIFLFLIAASVVMTACSQKKNPVTTVSKNSTIKSKTIIPDALQGGWMYGNFSMTEYWSQNPSEYLGNALELAIAFKFTADGKYEQYFTAKSVQLGITTYQQSVTKGTIEIDTINKTIRTYPTTSHYRRTRGSKVEQEQDMAKSELSVTSYSYTTGSEPNGTKALYLKLGTSNPLTFLKK
ncbi:MAG TPA: hypothetical protein VHM26_00795 [Chitinophagaceae bacterium]|jgi:hypothetical protein|nr:hypothetical protein [Chitinophagaceae bacterium]